MNGAVVGVHHFDGMVIRIVDNPRDLVLATVLRK